LTHTQDAQLGSNESALGKHENGEKTQRQRSSTIAARRRGTIVGKRQGDNHGYLLAADRKHCGQLFSDVQRVAMAIEDA
jgi:hypothetical protein